MFRTGKREKYEEVVNPNAKFKQYDRVRLLASKYEKDGVKAGHVGSILEVYSGNWYEVDFSDKEGTTILLTSFPEYELEAIE